MDWLSQLGTGFTFVIGLVVLNYFGIIDKFKPKNGNGEGNIEILKDYITQRMSGYDSDLMKEIQKTNTKLDYLTGKVETRFESDDGYHSAIVKNADRHESEIKEISSRVTRIEEQHRLKELKKITA